MSDELKITSDSTAVRITRMICLWGMVALLVLLKAFGYISWAWYWCFAPIWVPFVVAGAVAVMGISLMALFGFVYAAGFCCLYIYEKLKD